MAIGKLVKGGNAGGLVDYLLATTDHQGIVRPCVRIVGGTFGRTGQDAKCNFESFEALRPSLTRNVVHMSISLPEDDPELEDADWACMGRVWAEGMGFEGYLIVCHGHHIHIAASRIRLDGSVVSDSHDFRRSEALVRRIERQFGLRKVESSHLLAPGLAEIHVTAPTRGEFELASKGEISCKTRLQELLSGLTTGPITASDFVDVLEAQGVDVRPSLTVQTRQLAGFSFGLGGKHFTGSALGRAFKLKNLEKRGFEYDKDRDFQTLVEAKRRSEERTTVGTDAGERSAVLKEIVGEGREVRGTGQQEADSSREEVAPGTSSRIATTPKR